MSYKVDNIVKVKSDLIVGKEYFMGNHKVKDTFAEDMQEHLGKIATIIDTSSGEYLLNIDNVYLFTDEMLEN